MTSKVKWEAQRDGPGAVQPRQPAVKTCSLLPWQPSHGKVVHGALTGHKASAELTTSACKEASTPCKATAHLVACDASWALEDCGQQEADRKEHKASNAHVGRDVEPHQCPPQPAADSHHAFMSVCLPVGLPWHHNISSSHHACMSVSLPVGPPWHHDIPSPSCCCAEVLRHLLQCYAQQGQQLGRHFRNALCCGTHLWGAPATIHTQRKPLWAGSISK